MVDGRWSMVGGRSIVFAFALLSCSAHAGAQGRGGIASFPAQQREPADPAVVARGREVYDAQCASCHGADLRGGQGPNLLRSPLALNDQNGEMILPVLQGTHKQLLPASGNAAQEVQALAAFIHSVLARAPGQGAPPPGPPVELKVLVGDAQAGEKYFAARCASCHSVSGDLRGIGARYRSATELQNLWVAGGRAPVPQPGRRPAPMATRRETTVVVTLASGETFEGRLERVDDFVVSLTQADGTSRSFRRNGDVPKVVVRDPLEAHRNLLAVYTDKDIHDVTAYLTSVK
jgi:cytochrome c oxidase cbb3-type subunit 3